MSYFRKICGQPGHDENNCYTSDSAFPISLAAIANRATWKGDQFEFLELVFNYALVCQGLTEAHKEGIRNDLKSLMPQVLQKLQTQNSRGGGGHGRGTGGGRGFGNGRGNFNGGNGAETMVRTPGTTWVQEEEATTIKVEEGAQTGQIRDPIGRIKDQVQQGEVEDKEEWRPKSEIREQKTKHSSQRYAKVTGVTTTRSSAADSAERTCTALLNVDRREGERPTKQRVTRKIHQEQELVSMIQ